MSYLPSEKKVYYYSMRGSRYLFADERVKMHLLDLVGEIQRRDGWLLFAFCIMDDCAYFIIEASRITRVIRTLQYAVQKLLPLPDGKKRSRKAETELSGRTKQLDTLAEIADCCRQIHRIPLECGYVSRLEDYWWSSYPSYVGVHAWKLVEHRALSLYFSADPDIARRKLKQFHASEAEG